MDFTIDLRLKSIVQVKSYILLKKSQKLYTAKKKRSKVINSNLSIIDFSLKKKSLIIHTR